MYIWVSTMSMLQCIYAHAHSTDGDWSIDGDRGFESCSFSLKIDICFECFPLLCLVLLHVQWIYAYAYNLRTWNSHMAESRDLLWGKCRDMRSTRFTASTRNKRKKCARDLTTFRATVRDFFTQSFTQSLHREGKQQLEWNMASYLNWVMHMHFAARENTAFGWNDSWLIHYTLPWGLWLHGLPCITIFMYMYIYTICFTCCAWKLIRMCSTFHV